MTGLDGEVGTTGPITPAIVSAFQNVSAFFAKAGVTTSTINVAPYILTPGSTG